MRAPALLAALSTLAFGAGPALAQTIGPVDPGAQVDVSSPESVTVDGVSGVRVRSTPGPSQGYMVPDDKGGYVYYAPGPPLPKPSPSRADAEEVRLYARELATQITRGITGDVPLTGVVSVPSAFVDQDTRASSSFGRLMGEQMIYELNSRGFPVKEARGVAPARGRRAPAEPLAVLAGSYYVDRDNLFVNARLVTPSGQVLRTGSVLVPMTPTLRRMLGIPDYNGLRPTPPTLIGARNVEDAPCLAQATPVPYTPKYVPKHVKKAPAKKIVRKRAAKPAAKKRPCPPGCEPIDSSPKAQTGAKPQTAPPPPAK